MIKAFLLTLLSAVSLTFGGCAVANRAIQTDFTAFNSAVQYNQTQQMLLNIVRLHFREHPEFFQTASLSASYNSTLSSGAGIAGLGAPLVTKAASANIAYAFASTPTITYSPIDGKNYVQQFLSKITPETCSLLIDCGWSVKKIGDLLIERVDMKDGVALINRPSAATYPKFREWITALQDAQSKDELELRTDEKGSVIHTPKGDWQVSSLHFRSLLDVMYQSSKNVETPESQQNFVKRANGNGEIIVHSSRIPPSDVMLSVWFRGHYYSIRNDDLNSKDSFALLMELYRLQASPVGDTPLLTLPLK